MKDLTLSARLAMADENPDIREAKLRSVRRRLDFGNDKDDNSPSKEELERAFEAERSRHLEEKKKQWNFDFKEGRPLDGRWQWERVQKSNGRDAPAPGNADANAGRQREDAQDQAH